MRSSWPGSSKSAFVGVTRAITLGRRISGAGENRKVRTSGYLDPMSEITYDWLLEPGDCSSWRGSESGESTFTRLYIRYRDPQTGHEGVASANRIGGETLFLLERVAPKPPAAPAVMSSADAQELADTAIRLLGGQTEKHFWAELGSEQLVLDRDGARRPASEIKVGDVVLTPSHRDMRLLVSGVTAGDDNGVVVSLTNVGPEGFETAIRLMSLDLG